MNKKLTAQILLILVTVIWGSTFIMVKDALNDAGPFIFATMRFAIAGLLTIILLNKNIFNLSKLEIYGGFFAGFFLFGGYAFQNFGLIYTSASKSAFITSVSVLLVPIILYIFKVQKIKFKTWIAVFVATLGLFILINPTGENMNLGDILTLGCAICFAIHIIFQDFYLKKNVRVLHFFLIQTLTVAILSYFNSLIFEPVFVSWSTRLINAILITGIAGTFIAIIVMIWAQKILNPSQTAIIFTLEPVFAALFAILYAGEILGISGYIGGGIIVFAVGYSEI